MSFMKNRFNRVFSKTRSIFPTSLSSPSTPDFCDSEIHDPLFDCCFGFDLELKEMCRCDDKFTRNIKRHKKKHKKIKQPTNNKSSASKISPIGSKSTPNLSSNGRTTVRCCTPKSIENLCDQLDGIGFQTLTPRITRLYTQIPEHDKKILKRMAMKRTQEIAQMEDAWIARKCWEDERIVRDKLINKHSLQYMRTVKEKQKMESLAVERRLNDLARKEKLLSDEIRKSIHSKEEKLIHRLRTEKMRKKSMSRQRQLDEMRKFEAAAMIQQEIQLDEELRKQECFSNLENRINRAEEMRNKYLSNRRRRLCYDNEMEQNLHAANYDVTKRIELFKMEELKSKIQERNEKSIRFTEEKERYLMESRNQARASAELRDIVRNAISPDSYRSYKVRSACDRPVSNMSCNETHLKLG